MRVEKKRSSRASVACSGWFSLALVALGCSSPTAGSDTPVGAGTEPGTVVTTDGSPDPAAPGEAGLLPLAGFDESANADGMLSAQEPRFEVAADACVVATTRLRRAIGPVGAPVQYLTHVTYEQRSYDPERQLLTRLPLDNHGQLFESAQLNYRIQYERVAADGRLLMAAYEDGDAISRTDYLRDEHLNLLTVRRRRVPDLDGPPASIDDTSSIPSGAPTYTYTYDAAGLLVQSTGPVQHASYEHDAQQRCIRITDAPYQNEQWSYDERSRLSLEHVDYYDPSDLTRVLSSNETYHRYDDQGRLIAIDQDGGFNQNMDGTIDSYIHRTYRADGSLSIESVDGLTDTPEDPLPNGRRGTRSFEWLSPGCQALEASRPTSTSLRCASIY